MPATQQLSAKLPDEIAAQVRARVSSGEYASESEVLSDGVLALQAQERAVEHWLRTEGAAAYDAYKANPSRVFTLEQVRASLEAEHRRATGG